QQLTFELGGENQLLQVTPYQDEFGLDWLIVVAIPESDFLAQVKANTRDTILLCGIALVVATLIGILVSRWITNPVIRLSKASQAIAQGDLEQRVKTGGIGELGVLAQSFNQMAQQLRQSFTALAAANTELEGRVEDRTAALNQQTQALQDEVEHLLDVVSIVEEGDLTVTAEVSPTATGLVADTFNRLIERFGLIMATVAQAAEQVDRRTAQVQALAVDMATNARQQADSVNQVQTLMENINELSQGNVAHVAATDSAVIDTQKAIEQGQQEIATVTNDIGVLQQEMQHIVGRTQTLTSYTDLTAQFVKDQKRIASLTRVLAMNASMLSTRASQQQDPEQFAAITREFETVATQVNDLAAQTNQSLVVLQQRTEQIQTVVSGLNHDVENISQRADNLTTGVDQSNQSFNQIKATTQQLAVLGQQVTQSSQAIAEAAQTTLKSVQAISKIAVETSERADLTTKQSHTMEQVAQTLRQSVSFFHLPSGASSTQTDDGQPVPLNPAD
ncbi:MAG: methyl-accepting chemotaxis protein, partial [Cyanobacteria bacterium J06559_3]